MKYKIENYLSPLPSESVLSLSYVKDGNLNLLEIINSSLMRNDDNNYLGGVAINQYSLAYSSLEKGRKGKEMDRKEYRDIVISSKAILRQEYIGQEMSSELLVNLQQFMIALMSGKTRMKKVMGESYPYWDAILNQKNSTIVNVKNRVGNLGEDMLLFGTENFSLGFPDNLELLFFSNMKEIHARKLGSAIGINSYELVKLVMDKGMFSHSIAKMVEFAKNNDLGISEIKDLALYSYERSFNALTRSSKQLEKTLLRKEHMGTICEMYKNLLRIYDAEKNRDEVFSAKIKEKIDEYVDLFKANAPGKELPLLKKWLFALEKKGHPFVKNMSLLDEEVKESELLDYDTVETLDYLISVNKIVSYQLNNWEVAVNPDTITNEYSSRVSTDLGSEIIANMKFEKTYFKGNDCLKISLFKKDGADSDDFKFLTKAFVNKLLVEKITKPWNKDVFQKFEMEAIIKRTESLMNDDVKKSQEKEDVKIKVKKF